MELKVTSDTSSDDHQPQHDHSGATMVDPPSAHPVPVYEPQSATEAIEATYETYLQGESHSGNALLVAHPQIHPGFSFPSFGHAGVGVFNPVYATPSYESQPESGLGWPEQMSCGPFYQPTQNVSPIHPFGRKPARSGEVSTCSSDDETPRSIANGGQRNEIPRRLPGACSNCKRLKMKCVYAEASSVCNRCQHSGKPCIIEQRRRGGMLNKRELLMRELASKEQVIDSLLSLIQDMSESVNWPPNVPGPKGPVNTQRLPDHEVLEWVKSVRQSKLPVLPRPVRGINDNQGGLMDAASAPLAGSSIRRLGNGATSSVASESSVEDMVSHALPRVFRTNLRTPEQLKEMKDEH